MRGRGVESSATHTIGEVCDEVLDGQGAGLELVIQPGESHCQFWESREEQEREKYHFVKVFCCTLIHCFSTVNMLATFRPIGGRCG